MKSLVIVSSDASARHVKRWVRKHRPVEGEWEQVNFGISADLLRRIGISSLDVNADLTQVMNQEGNRLRNSLSVLLERYPSMLHAKMTELNFADEWWRAYTEALFVRRLVRSNEFRDIVVVGPGLLLREALRNELEGFGFDERSLSAVDRLRRMSRVVRTLVLAIWNFLNATFFLSWLAMQRSRSASGMTGRRVVLWSTFPNSWIVKNLPLQSRILPPECFPENEPLHFVSCLHSNSEKSRSFWAAIASFRRLRAEQCFVEPHEKLTLKDLAAAYVRRPQINYRAFALAKADLNVPGSAIEHWLRFRYIDAPKCRLLALSCSRLSEYEESIQVVYILGFEFIEGRAVTSGFRLANTDAVVCGVQHGVGTLFHLWRLAFAPSAVAATLSSIAPNQLLVEGRSLQRLLKPTWGERVQIVGAPRLSRENLTVVKIKRETNRLQCLVVLDMHRWSALLGFAEEMALRFPDVDFVVCPHPAKKVKVASKTKLTRPNFKVAFDTHSSATTANFGVVSASGISVELAIRGLPLFVFCPPGNFDLSPIGAHLRSQPRFDGSVSSFCSILDYLENQQQTGPKSPDLIIEDLVEGVTCERFYVLTKDFLSPEIGTNPSKDIGGHN